MHFHNYNLSKYLVEALTLPCTITSSSLDKCSFVEIVVAPPLSSPLPFCLQIMGPPLTYLSSEIKFESLFISILIPQMKCNKKNLRGLSVIFKG